MAGDFGIYSERKLRRSIQDKADDLCISYAEARKLILEQVIKPANEQFEENFQKLLNKIDKKLSVPLKAQEPNILTKVAEIVNKKKEINENGKAD